MRCAGHNNNLCPVTSCHISCMINELISAHSAHNIPRLPQNGSTSVDLNHGKSFRQRLPELSREGDGHADKERSWSCQLAAVLGNQHN